MAEAILQQMTNYNTPIQDLIIGRIDSCGTLGMLKTSQPHPLTFAVLRSRGGITDFRHQSRVIRIPEDVLEFDYILCMTRAQMRDIWNMVRGALRSESLTQPDQMGKIMLCGEFGGQEEAEEVPDPWDGENTTLAGFEATYDQLERLTRGLLAHIHQEARQLEEELEQGEMQPGVHTP